MNEVMDSFDRYKGEFEIETSRSLDGNFGISNAAVKKSAKDFKSILKLDKNFHIYIHGDRELIERGQDSDGKKFYKIYFENES